MRDATMSAVLVLNSSYEPVSFCSGRRALVLVVKNAATVEVDTEREIHLRYMLPSVIRLREFHHIPHKSQVVSRKNILLRDRDTCQYCAVKFHPSALTLDHVIPRSQGGPSSWANLVACCSPCNRKKANRTPEEAGMMLLRRPRPMTIHTSRFLMRSMGVDDPKWAPYLYTESDKRYTHS